MSDLPSETAAPADELITVPEISLHYSRLILPAVITTWVLCLLLGPLAVIRAWNSAQSWGPLLILLGIATLQGVLGTRWLLAPGQRLLNRGLFRFAEFILLLVLVRLFVWAAVAPPSASQLRQLLLEPMTILDGGYLLFLFFTIASWSIAGSISQIFFGMAVLPEEVQYLSARDSMSGQPQLDVFNIVNLRSNQLQSFLSYWLNGALLLVFCTAAASYDLRNMSGQSWRSVTRLGLPPELLVALILFFTLGLWLLSWGRLQVMQLRWLTEKRAVHRPVPTQWQRSSLLLITAVALLAGFLPIGSTFALARLVQALVSVVVYIVGFLISLTFLILSLLFGLFGRQPPESLQPEEILPTEPPPPLVEPSRGPGSFRHGLANPGQHLLVPGHRRYRSPVGFLPARTRLSARQPHPASALARFALGLASTVGLSFWPGRAGQPGNPPTAGPEPGPYG